MSETQSITSYKTPKNVLLVVVKAGVAKGLSEWWQLLALGWHAGIFVGIGGGLTIAVAAALDAAITGTIPLYNGVGEESGEVTLKLATPSGMKKFVTGALFPVALFLVVFTGAELFTGNIMYMLAARLGNQTTWQKLIKNWFFSYFGNLCGCLAVAYFMFHLPETFHAENYKNHLASIAELKRHTGNFGMYFLKGIGANYLVCLALWSCLSADDVVSKIVAMWWPIMAFVCCGFEHSIANMFFVPMAIMSHATTITPTEFILRNLIPVTLGNMAGAALLICTQFLIYHSYAMPAIQEIQLQQGGKKNSKSDHVMVVEGKHIIPISKDMVKICLSKLSRKFKKNCIRNPIRSEVSNRKITQAPLDIEAKDNNAVEEVQKT